MALRGSGVARPVPAAKPAGSENVVSDNSRVISLSLAPLLAPYKRHGRLSLRIERLPQLARLSAGRNNGNGSWSLGLDELDGLQYLPPDGMRAAHTLALRVIALEEDGATLALLDVPIAFDHPRPDADRGTDDAYLRRLSDELNNVKAALAARDAELAAARQRSETARSQAAAQQIDAELVSARATWKAELDQRLAQAAQKSEQALADAKSIWQAEQDSRVAQSEAKTQARVVEGRERWKREAQEALSQAEMSWRGAETKRFAEAEAKWQAAIAKAQAETQTNGAAAAKTNDAEVAQLRADLHDAKDALARRDAKLAEMQNADAARADAEARLHNTEQALASLQAEAERAQAQSQRDIQSAVQRAEGLQQKLAAQETGARATGDAETQRLQSEIASLEARVAERDAAVADLKAVSNNFATERAEAAVQLADLKVRYAQIETALAEARTASPDDGDRSALEAALSDAQAKLSVREAELERTKNDSERAAERAKRDTAAAIARAQEEWQANVAERTPDTRNDDREALSAALSEARSRYEAAETALGQMRQRAAREQAGDGGRLKEEFAALQTVLAERETELAYARATLESRGLITPGVEIHKIEQAKAEVKSRAAERRGAATRKLLKEILIVVALVAAVMLAYPHLVALMPDAWRVEIANIIGGDLVGVKFQAPAKHAATPGSATASGTATASVLRGANLRSAPSAKSKALAHLARGDVVSVLETKGNWTRVTAGKTEGWVYSTTLGAAQRK